jgi:hypothetical protein
MRTAIAALATLGALPSPVLGMQPDADGYTWATIGHAGNRHTNNSETPTRPDLNIGAVGYEFRMATTEVTVSQWLQFVQAFEPFYQYPRCGHCRHDRFHQHKHQCRLRQHRTSFLGLPQSVR